MTPEEYQGIQAGSKYLGIDIERTADGDPKLTFGDFTIARGEPVAISDIIERIRTLITTEFYDRYFGETIEDYVEAPDTWAHRLELQIHLERAVEADPRVKPETAIATITTWKQNPRHIKVDLSWIWVGLNATGNLVVDLTKKGGGAVITAFAPVANAEG